ncbi:betaine--homocysteine S-methyltransferase [Oceanibacterium hippocampi]|uniref:Bifunctional homocysteine S-methyltransferase/5,10-methylenetetrahydrofolate reductase n=1 Tax=Oceanibacterium hippocampi TaxID=745714 RepID=A0A1Y5TDQ2_9PROT|nr:betaine--homocysteine S-methyltransferase [Oceanibacterium hippocampi]SLN59671.1 Bifunctional homocysteine S-methyltransferase/5,10-methylenetetrahydrofolate reductase [Oceanibacterium hippocampi]
MSDRFRALLAERPYLVADGAMGTSLFAVGLESGDAPELWNLSRPEKVEAVHRAFVAAGADILLTNSFGGNRYRLALHRAEGEVGPLNRAAAARARMAADDAGRPVLVAGSMGPTGELMAPLGSLTEQACADSYREQGEALRDGGVDLLWLETLSSAEELQAAVAGIADLGLPFVCTMTFDTNGRTMMGLTPAAMVTLMAGLPVAPAAYGANCGVGPGELLDSVLALSEAAAPDAVIVAKGNCGIPEYDDGAIRYRGTPATMAEYGRLARGAGARIIGGCCGTTAEHLASLANALAAFDGNPLPRPDRKQVAAALGPLWGGRSTTPSGEPSRGQRERRRRR